MPHPRLRLRLLALAGAAVAALAAPSAANAGLLVTSASCDDQSSAQVFRPWADLADYVLNAGGDFEHGATGWSVDGAQSDWDFGGGTATSTGNEPWRVTDGADNTSLKIPPGSSATSSVQCVGIEHPTLRFFAKRSGGGLTGGLSVLTVEVLAQTTLGLTASVPIGVITNDGTWSPTLPIPVIANLLPLLPGDHTPVQFRFTPLGTATWQIDDVYVDPRSKG